MEGVDESVTDAHIVIQTQVIHVQTLMRTEVDICLLCQHAMSLVTPGLILSAFSTIPFRKLDSAECTLVIFVALH